MFIVVHLVEQQIDVIWQQPSQLRAAHAMYLEIGARDWAGRCGRPVDKVCRIEI